MREKIGSVCIAVVYHATVAIMTTVGDKPVTQNQLHVALQQTETKIFQAMSEEFTQISQRMATKDDIGEVKGMLVDVLTQLKSQQDDPHKG